MKQLQAIYGLLDHALQDDETPYGGIAFMGETLRDFLEEIGMNEINNLEDLNELLKENGIKPIVVK